MIIEIAVYSDDMKLCHRARMTDIEYPNINDGKNILWHKYRMCKIKLNDKLIKLKGHGQGAIR